MNHAGSEYIYMVDLGQASKVPLQHSIQSDKQQQKNPPKKSCKPTNGSIERVNVGNPREERKEQ